jgi:hypothetical protein
MSRKAKTYTIVGIDENSPTLVADSGLTLEQVQTRLASNKDPAGTFVFKGEPISYSVDTAPRVTIGTGRKPRAKKEPAAAKRKGKGTNGTSTTVTA